MDFEILNDSQIQREVVFGRKKRSLMFEYLPSFGWHPALSRTSRIDLFSETRRLFSDDKTTSKFLLRLALMKILQRKATLLYTTKTSWVFVFPYNNEFLCFAFSVCKKGYGHSLLTFLSTAALFSFPAQSFFWQSLQEAASLIHVPPYVALLVRFRFGHPLIRQI